MVGKSLPVRNAIKSTGMYLGRIITLRLEDLFSDRIQACERPSVRPRPRSPESLAGDQSLISLVFLCYLIDDAIISPNLTCPWIIHNTWSGKPRIDCRLLVMKYQTFSRRLL